MERLKSALADRYTIEHELGAGGMATVYLAHDVKHDRKVAVKVLRPELAAVVGAERFLQEIKTTANLQHPHILPLFESGEADSFLYYVMPYVEGESLRDKLNREKQLPIDEAVRLTSQVADALHYAHERDVIHRDIKPENILLHNGNATVADFGIALAVQQAGGNRLTETGLSLGTPHYMSPEQAAGERALDARTDVYALACVLYEMLTGEPPFDGPTAQAVVAKVLTAEPVEPTELRKTVPPHVAAAVLTGLQKLPADRFGSTAEFAVQLATPGFAGREGRRTATTGTVRRGPIWGQARLAWAVAAVLTVVVLVLAVSRPPATLVEVTRLDVRLPSGMRFEPSGLDQGEGLALSRDGQVLAFSVTAGGVSQIALRRMDDDSVRLVAGSAGSHGGVAFSPNGRWLAFVTESTIFKTLVSGGSRIPITNVPWGHLAWAGNDTIIYTPTYNAGLWSVSAEGGDGAALTQPDREADELGHWWPQVLPDGEHVLFTNYTTPADRSHIEVLSLRTGKRNVVLRDGYYGRYAAGHLLFIRGTVVMAVPFDLDALATSGTPDPVLDDVALNPTDGFALLSVADNGTLSYAGGQTTLTQLVWIDDEGNEELAVDSLGRYRWPAVSPNGDRFAVIRDRDLWSVDVIRRVFSRLTRTDKGEQFPTWTPDGRSVLYSRDELVFDIFRRAADMSSAEQPVAVSLIDKHPTSVSLDGILLYYEQADSLMREIWAVPLDGSGEPVLLVSAPGNQHRAVFSPDGNWIVYGTNRSGRFEICAMAYPPAGGPPCVRVSTAGGNRPKWARDGRAIYYDFAGQVFRVPVLSPGVFGVPQALPTIEGLVDWDLAPDGRLLVVRTPPGSVGRHSVKVVLNWTEELLRRRE